MNRMVAALALFLFSAPTLAEDKDTVSLYLNTGTYFFDSSRPEEFVGDDFPNDSYEDSAGIGIGIGYNITEHWSFEGYYSRFDTDLEDSGIDVRVDVYHLDFMYNFHRWLDCWTPYVAFGIGETWLDGELNEEDRSLQGNLGLGLKFHSGNRIQYRFEMRGYRDDDFTDAKVTFGIGYLFGGDDWRYHN